MRRYRTRTTAWPAVADLMTALAVVGLACAVLMAIRERDAIAEVDRLDGEVDRLEGQVDRLEHVGDSLQVANNGLKRTIERQQVVIDSLGVGLEDDEVPAFLPCWPDAASNSYYRTYVVTIEDGFFSILPHRHWAMGAEFRAAIPASVMSVLEDHPRGAVAGDQVVSFGRRAHRAVREAAQESDDMADCKLAVTINRSANGHEIGVLTSAGFYPVYRD